MGKPTIHGQAQTFDPNLEPEDGDDEALDDVRVVRVRSIRLKPSAHGAPHVVDAKEAVDPAPLLLEALADKHLIHPSQRRRVRPRGSLRTNFGYIHRGPVSPTHTMLAAQVSSYGGTSKRVSEKAS
jgi:hypothetical protein